MDQGNGAKPLAIVDGGVAADDFARVDVAWDTALGGGDNAIADGAMAGDPDLTTLVITAGGLARERNRRRA